MHPGRNDELGVMVRVLLCLGCCIGSENGFLSSEVTCCTAQGIRFVLLLSRQGKVRLAKWYTTYTQKERSKVRALHFMLGKRCPCLLRTVTLPAHCFRSGRPWCKAC